MYRCAGHWGSFSLGFSLGFNIVGTFSVDDCWREGGAGREEEVEVGAVDGSPGTGVVALGGDFVPPPVSDPEPVLLVSRAENMRVSRLVMDCFSFAGL